MNEEQKQLKREIYILKEQQHILKTILNCKKASLAVLKADKRREINNEN